MAEAGGSISNSSCAGTTNPADGRILLVSGLSQLLTADLNRPHCFRLGAFLASQGRTGRTEEGSSRSCTRSYI